MKWCDFKNQGDRIKNQSLFIRLTPLDSTKRQALSAKPGN